MGDRVGRDEFLAAQRTRQGINKTTSNPRAVNGDMENDLPRVRMKQVEHCSVLFPRACISFCSSRVGTSGKKVDLSQAVIIRLLNQIIAVVC